MKKVIFLLEEPSMKEFLERFLPRLSPGLDFLCITHEGKQDLEKSIPRKLRAFQQELFVIVRDNDSADCLAIKARLQRICKREGQSDALIRIACQELEAWYLGADGTGRCLCPPTVGRIGSQGKIPQSGSPRQSFFRARQIGA